jgi:hypothetical protein
MPWGYFRNMTDDDLKAIYAYLQTVTPVQIPAASLASEAVLDRIAGFFRISFLQLTIQPCLREA